MPAPGPGEAGASARAPSSLRSYAVRHRRAPAPSEEPRRPQEQYEDHEREHGGGQIDGLVGRQQAVDQARDEADREAAERRRPEPVDAADDDADEDDDRVA